MYTSWIWHFWVISFFQTMVILLWYAWFSHLESFRYSKGVVTCHMFWNFCQRNFLCKAGLDSISLRRHPFSFTSWFVNESERFSVGGPQAFSTSVGMKLFSNILRVFLSESIFGKSCHGFPKRIFILPCGLTIVMRHSLSSLFLFQLPSWHNNEFSLYFLPLFLGNMWV